MHFKIPLISNLYYYLNTFVKEVGKNIYLYFCISVATGFLEGLGFAILIPAFFSFYNLSNSTNQINEYLKKVFGYFGFNLNVEVFYVLLFIFLLVRGLLLFYASAVKVKIITNAHKNVYNKILGAFYKMGYKYYLDTNSGYLNNLIKTESGRSVYSISQYVAAVSSILMAIVSLAISLFANFYFSVTVILISATVMYCLKSFFSKTRKYSIDNANIGGKLQNLIFQVSSNFKYLYSTNAFSKVKPQIDQTCDEVVKISYQLMLLGMLVNVFSQTMLIISLFGVIYVFIELVKISPTDVLLSIVLCQRGMSHIISFQQSWHKFNDFAGSIKIYLKGIKEITNSHETPGIIPFKEFKENIRFDHVKFSFGDSFHLNIEHLEIKKKQVVSFVGSSGSGKTTVIDMLTGILRPNSGNIYIDGVSMNEINIYEFRLKIGLVTQETVLFNDTIRNNVTMWDKSIDENRLQYSLEVSNCIDFISRFPNGLSTQIGEKGIKLSGGQRQRIAIAREVYKNPDILIFDEATSALDSESEVKIQEALNLLKGKLTLVIIAHRFSTIQFSDQIFVLENGQLIESGSFKVLSEVQNSRFKSLLDKQKL